MFKKILIIALNEKWSGISRLPAGLQRAGFQVYALCPKNSYLAKTKFLQKSILYPTCTYSRSKIIYLLITAAIVIFHPDLIIPGDEDSLLALCRFANFLEKKSWLPSISQIIRKSLPSKLHDETILNKSDFQKKCKEWKLRTPLNITITNLSEAITIAQEISYPIVLKHDYGCGGSGVFICKNEQELQENFHFIKKQSFLQKIKKPLKKLFFVSLLASNDKISLQQFIDGPIGQSPFCAQNGKIYGFNSMIKLKTYPNHTGPSSVVSSFDNRDIPQYLEKVARELQYTGFGSLEYIVEKTTNLIYIIELNPRPTPTCHLDSTIITNDLCELFFKGLNFLPTQISFSKTYTIAMFPGEKRRDPQSIYLTDFYHDVPWDDPNLLMALDS